MDFDLDEGLYAFEVTLGYRVGHTEQMTTPLVLQADDVEEAEETVMEYLELLHLGSKFWIVEISGPYDPREYQKLIDEGEHERWDRLEDYSEEDFQEILQSEDL
jgi:hypothetical protein